MAIKEEEEEHVNHERWLISYADMITLLMVLFVVMFAISQVDQRKFDELKDGMAAGFGQAPTPMNGEPNVLDGQENPLAPVAPELMQATPVAADAEFAPDKAEQERAAARLAEAEAEVGRLDDVAQRVRRALEKAGLADDVKIDLNEKGLTLSLVSKNIVFAADRAELTRRGEQVVDTLGPVLADLPDQIEVAGHTNQVKVRPKYFPTEWELSSARATTVLRRLTERDGVSGRRLTAVAHGDEVPLVDPKDPTAARLNKRVDITVVSSAPEETRALFKQALSELRKKEDR